MTSGRAKIKGLPIRLVIRILPLLGVLAVAGCGSASSSVSHPAGSPPAGGAPTAELRHRWASPDRPMMVIAVSADGYSINSSKGKVAQKGDELAFYDEDFCRKNLPDGVGHYHWSLSGDTLTLTPIGQDPCEARAMMMGGPLKPQG